MPERFHQILLVSSILWLSWLTMMLVHETGHVIGALGTGGRVQRVIWHPAVISRTDVRPNPHPLIEIWAGPMIGSLLPLVAAVMASLLRLRAAYLVWVLAGFCLIANGAYIGVGAFHPICDAEELIAHGMPRWPMAAFGIIALICGLWIWHRISPKLGFGDLPEPIQPRHAYLTACLSVVVTIIGLAVGNRSPL
jgi:hypothetical protein